MSTNFYATVKVVGDETTPEFRMHLGKTSSGIAMVDGNLFDSFKSMVDFLRYNKKNIQIEDEYGTPFTLEEFENRFRGDHSDNFRIFEKHYTDSGRSWMDDDGFIVSMGVWF